MFLNGLADELLHRGELLGEQFHVLAHLLRRDFRVYLGRADARVPISFDSVSMGTPLERHIVVAYE